MYFVISKTTCRVPFLKSMEDISKKFKHIEMDHPTVVISKQVSSEVTKQHAIFSYSDLLRKFIIIRNSKNL